MISPRKISPAPLVLFVYNRPEHTQQTVEALLRNPLAHQSELYVFADGAKQPEDQAKVEEVRQYVRAITGFATITIAENPNNAGLANSVIRGVTEVLERHGRAIVMEDDMICTADFLYFMNDALHFYENNQKIFSISGYLYPITIPQDYSSDVCLLPRASSWGWATWSDRWRQADWQLRDVHAFAHDPLAQAAFMTGGEDLLPMLQKQQKGLIDSWAIRWTYTHFKHQAYCLLPIRSKINNIGADGSGTHLRRTRRYSTAIYEGDYVLPSDPQPDPVLIENLQRFFKLSRLRRFINRLTL